MAAGQMPVMGDPEYGDQVATDEQIAAVPESETPLVEATVSQNATVSETGNIPIPGTANPNLGNRFTGRAQNLLRLPPEVLNMEQRAETPIENQYKAGMLWEVLASDPNSSETVRYIASQLKGS
jgi:hypothetical protein